MQECRTKETLMGRLPLSRQGLQQCHTRRTAQMHSRNKNNILSSTSSCIQVRRSDYSNARLHRLICIIENIFLHKTSIHLFALDSFSRPKLIHKNFHAFRTSLHTHRVHTIFPYTSTGWALTPIRIKISNVTLILLQCRFHSEGSFPDSPDLYRETPGRDILVCADVGRGAAQARRAGQVERIRHPLHRNALVVQRRT